MEYAENRLDELNPSTDELRLMETEQQEDAMAVQKFEEAFERGIYTDGSEGDFYLGDSTKLYLADIGKVPLLTAEQELELGKTIKEGGEQALQARNALVMANMRLVVYYAKKQLRSGVELSELISLGAVGLMKAADKFDYTLGFRFSTYASWWIKQAISRGLLNCGNSVRIPLHMNESIQKIGKAQRSLEQELGKEPTAGEIARFLSVEEKKVEEALGAMYNVVSLDTKIGEEGDTTMGDLLADEKAYEPYEEITKLDLQRVIQVALKKLPPKEAKVLMLRYGIGECEPMTLEDISNLPEFGVSRERVRQIENAAIRKIRRNPKVMQLLRDFVA